MALQTSRRSVLFGSLLALAAPAVVRAGSIMRVRSGLILPGIVQTKSAADFYWRPSSSETGVQAVSLRNPEVAALVGRQSVSFRYGYEPTDISEMEKLAALAARQQMQREVAIQAQQIRQPILHRQRMALGNPVRLASLRAKYGDAAVDAVTAGITA